jgi:microcystin-dependent protein
MATTTNYGWTTPDDTALVKDGAAAIRTLGSSVDTTTKNLNPETTLGDISYRSSTANVNTRLPLGTAGQVLKVNSGATAPEWSSDNAGMTNPMTTTGDTIYSSSGSTPARLGIGSSGQVLTVASGVPSWASPAGTPVGTVIFHAKNTAPTGFLKANGAAVSRSTYSALFTEIGTTFGVGDGSTTFNVPDMRGYFVRGWADDGSIDSGRTFGTTQSATSFTANTDNFGDGARGQASRFQNSDGDDGSASVGSSTSNADRTITYRKVRPVNLALLACIKF